MSLNVEVVSVEVNAETNVTQVVLATPTGAVAPLGSMAYRNIHVLNETPSDDLGQEGDLCIVVPQG